MLEEAAIIYVVLALFGIGTGSLLCISITLASIAQTLKRKNTAIPRKNTYRIVKG